MDDAYQKELADLPPPKGGMNGADRPQKIHCGLDRRRVGASERLPACGQTKIRRISPVQTARND